MVLPKKKAASNAQDLKTFLTFSVMSPSFCGRRINGWFNSPRVSPVSFFPLISPSLFSWYRLDRRRVNPIRRNWLTNIKKAVIIILFLHSSIVTWNRERMVVVNHLFSISGKISGAGVIHTNHICPL